MRASLSVSAVTLITYRFVLYCSAAAQDLDNVTISGKVTDTDRAPIAGSDRNGNADADRSRTQCGHRSRGPLHIAT